MKFSKGDIIRVKQNGSLGTIMEAGKETSGREYYDVTWHHFNNGTHRYFDDELDENDWEFYSSSTVSFSSNVLPSGANYSDGYTYSGVDYSGMIKDPSGEHCLHRWKEYNSGWTKYEYCEKCNKERQGE